MDKWFRPTLYWACDYLLMLGLKLNYVSKRGSGCLPKHYNDVIMSEIASQITSLTIVYSIVYADADQRKHQSSASLAFVRGIHRGPVNSPHKWPVTRKMFPFDDVIMIPTMSTTPAWSNSCRTTFFITFRVTAVARTRPTRIWLNKHIEVETRWPPFFRRHFQMHFLEWKCFNLD